MRRNLIVWLLGSVVLSGCAFIGRSEEENSFTKADIKKIEPGRTTREEILNWLGPPLAIAKKGEEDKIVPLENVRAATFLELFATKHILTEYDVIYYYRNVETTGSAVLVIAVASETSKKATTKLWVLIDSRSGIVEDYVTSEKK